MLDVVSFLYTPDRFQSNENSPLADVARRSRPLSSLLTRTGSSYVNSDRNVTAPSDDDTPPRTLLASLLASRRRNDANSGKRRRNKNRKRNQQACGAHPSETYARMSYVTFILLCGLRSYVFQLFFPFFRNYLASCVHIAINQFLAHLYAKCADVDSPDHVGRRSAGCCESRG